MNGVIIIDKPPKYTSFDIVRIVKKTINSPKVGHAGTLDPLATGVLPILIGEATKVQSILPDTDKEYIGSFKLGITTDTQDITGKILQQRNFSVTIEDLQKVLKLFEGEIYQIVPMFSAAKKNGVRLYSLARKGIIVERTPKKIKIKKLRIVNFDSLTGEGQLRVSCSSGTYIRTLCNDIGNCLGCGATMTALRRVSACGFFEEQSISIEKLKNLDKEQIRKEYLIKIQEIFSCYPNLKVSEAQSIRFYNGGPLSLQRLDFNQNTNDKDKFCVYSKNNIFIGIGTVNKKNDELTILKTFKTCEEASFAHSTSFKKL